MALISGLFRRKFFNNAIPSIYYQTRQLRRSQKKKQWPFVILRPDKESYDEILDLMWQSYFKEEPIIKSLGLGTTPNNIFDEHIIKALSQGLSLVARCRYDGCIVGAAINEGTCPWDPDAWDKFACTLCNINMRRLYQFYAYVQRLPDLWNLACTSKIFEISHLCVKSDDRGQGLGRALVRQSIETGGDCGYSCIRLDASSVKSQKICENLKMKLVYDIPYCTYIGPNNKAVINPSPPDTSLKVYVATPLMPPRKK